MDQVRDDLESNARLWVASSNAARERLWLATYGWPHGGIADSPAICYPRGATLYDSDYTAWRTYCKQRDAALQLPTINLV